MSKAVPQHLLLSDVPAQPGDIVFCLDSHGRIIQWNDVAAEAFGFGWPDVQGVPFDAVLPRHGSGPDRARFDIDRVMAGNDFSGGLDCRRRDGKPLALYLYATAGRDETGSIAGVFCVGREVTAFREAGLSVRASEEKFRVLFNLSPDIIALLDAQGRFVEVNDTGLALAGRDRDELTGTNALELVPPGSRRQTEAQFSRVWRREIIEGVTELEPGAGKRFQFEYRAAPLRLEGRNLALVVGRDATERLAAEARLVEREERFRAIFESVRDGLFLETLDGRVLEANPAAAELLGYRPDELLELRTSDLVPAETRAWLPQLIQVILASGEFHGEGVNLHRSGREIPVEISCSRVERAGGADPLVLVAARDITERKRVERELRAMAETAMELVRMAPGEDLFDFAARGFVRLVPGAAVAAGATRVESVAGFPAGGEELLAGLLGRPLIGLKFERDDPAVIESLVSGRLVEIPGGLCGVLLGRVPEDDCRAVEDRFGTGGAFVVGLRRGERALGSVFILPPRGTRPDARVVETFASQVSVALDRQQAEAAVRESREEFSSLFDRSPVGIYRTTPDGRILMANPALVRMLGCRSLDELSARRLADAGFQPGYDRDEFCRRLEADGEITGLETTWTRADGSRVYVRENARLVRDSDGRPEYYEGTVEDLTERRRAEEEVWQARERLRNLQDNVPVGLYRTTADGRFLAANRTAVAMFGYGSEEELKAAGVGAVYADPVQRREMLARLVAEGRLENVELRVRRRDGSEFDGLLNVTADRDETGALLSADGAIQDISDRKAAEAARRESEERYRRLVELSPDGLAVHQDGVIRMVNPAGARTLGYDSPDEMVGMPVLGLVHPDDRVRVMARIAAVLERNEPGELAEERFRRRDGSWVWVEVVSAPFSWEGKAAVQVVVRDISERRQAEEARREAERRYRQVVERATDGICIVQEGRLVFVNERLARMAGHAADELAGKPFERHLHPESRALVADRYRRRMAGEPVPEIYEAALLTAGGARIDAELSAGVIDYHGRPADLVFVRDISERRQHQAELAESEERYRQLFELAPNGIAVHQGGVIKMVNPAVLAILGYASAGELVGRPVLDFVHPDDRAAVTARMRQAADQGRMAPLARERFVRKDGTPVWVEAVGTPFTWGGRPAVRVFVRDISERVRARQQAEEMTELLGTVLNFSPHGFAVVQGREVVMANRAWANLLGCDSPDELVGEDYLERVPAEDRARAEEGAGSPVLAGGRTITETIRLRGRDGGIVAIPMLIRVASWRGRPALFLMSRAPGR